MARKGKPPGSSDARGPIYGRNQAGKPVCFAHPEAARGPCMSPIRISPSGRCRSHGGAEGSGRPIEHGGRSRLYESFRILSQADAARNDPEIQSHLENIVFVEALMRATADDITGPPGEFWTRASELYDQAVKGASPSALIELGKVLAEGQSNAAKLEKLKELRIEQRGHRLAEDRRQSQLQTSLSARQLMVFVKQLLIAIEDVLRDESIPRTKLFGAIRLRFIKLCGGGDLQGAIGP